MGRGGGAALHRAAATLTLLIAILLGTHALDHAHPPDLSRAASGTEILDRNNRHLSILPAPGGVWRLASTAEEVSPLYLDLLLATEDARFHWHPGVDSLALARAAYQWATRGRIVSGGSTITMQVVRLLEPRPRTLRSKAIEIARAWQLEQRLTKREILGLYLTLAPMGGNVEGVRAASLLWFGRLPSQLEPEEAALLVALPQRPSALRPDRFADRAQAARDRVLARAGLPPSSLAVPAARLPLPGLAPHLARRLARVHPGERIPTTLDVGLQREAERVARAAGHATPHAAAALAIMDARSRELRAYVAHSHPFDEARGGALDLLRAVRSPGSALKPFIYAAAFDGGVLQPDTRLADLPQRFGDWAPENFDRGFHGAVTVRDALRLSLNVPAVAALQAVGPLAFAQAMRAAGAPIRLPPGAVPGLPMALGGGGVRPIELLALYAALGDDGNAAAPLLRPGDAASRAPFVTPATARAIGAILAESPPPPGAAPTLRIAWKTGTSWGFRDAWAAGFDGAHAALAWIGRPDGTPLPGATGRNAAAPLLFAAFDLLPAAPLPLPLPSPVVARAAPAPRTDPVRLLFPPPGANLAAEAGHITLRASGGRRPLAWLVDGAPLASQPHRREVGWQPAGPGFYRITVLDADGAAASAEVRVRP
jgi:penicillin-binding protein 1C